MAKTSVKVRIRKSAPTARDMVKAPELVKASSKSRIPRLFSNLFQSDNKLIRIIKRVLSVLIPRYFINAWREVRQVIWPSRKETWRLTLAVFTFAIVFGAAVAVVDKGLDEFFKRVILK